MLNRLRLWLRSFVLRRRLEREMREEMAEHLERSTARLRARGLSEAEAVLQAKREFGNVTYLQEAGRDARGTRWVDDLIADSRFALRFFARKPWTTMVMFVVLAAGMSISTILFSFVHSYRTSSPPQVRFADDLVRIRGSRDAGAAGRSARSFSDQELREYRSLSAVFRSVAGWADDWVLLDAGAEDHRRGLQAKVSFVTENYASVLGVRPVLGGGLPTVAAADTEAAAVAVIGHAAWDRLFARSPDAIGSTLQVNGVWVTVVGVMPERFVGIGGYTEFQLWMPLAMRSALVADPFGGFRAVARLQPGVSLGSATAAARVVAAAAADSVQGLRLFDPSVEVLPLLSANGDPMFDRDVKLMSFAVSLLGLLVLLVTCTNVSALLTGLASARRQEIAVRLSLGAARVRVVRQLLTESALLATAAAGAALGIVALELRVFNRYVPDLPLELRVTSAATLFTFGIALVVGVAFGVSPALHATRLALASALRDSTARLAAARARLQKSLVVAQIAFTQPLIVLLAAALVLIASNYRVVGDGDASERLVTVNIRPLAKGDSEGPAAVAARERQRAVMRNLLARLQTTPGVVAAVVDWRAGMDLGSYTLHSLERDRRDGKDPVRVSAYRTAPGFLAMNGMPVLHGRDFGTADNGSIAGGSGEVPVIIGADLARRLWRTANPIGRRLQSASDTTTRARVLVVQGIVEDPLAERRRAGEEYRVFIPADTTQVAASLLIQSAAVAAPLLPSIREAVRQEAPGTGWVVRTVAEIEEENLRHTRIVTSGLLAAGFAALFLSAIGLYAVVAFSVSQRTSEIAVRMAVGARSRQIVRKFVGDGLRLSVLGLALGLPVSIFGLRFLLNLVEDVPVGLPAVTTIAVLSVMVVATAAVWIPARRAAAVDPAVSLRRE